MEGNKRKGGKYKPVGGNGFGPEPVDNPARRPLPKSGDTHHDPSWQIWSKHAPSHLAGYYWVCGHRLWPKIVEFRFVAGVLRPLDNHGSGAWTKYAGPIPDPVAPVSLFKDSNYT